MEYEEEEDKVENNSKEMFDSLATLAEVSLATAGKLEADQSLKRKIDQARAKITSKTSKNYSKSHPAVTTKTILPITPEMSSKRTMQVRFQLQLRRFLHSTCHSSSSLMLYVAISYANI